MGIDVGTSFKAVMAVKEGLGFRISSARDILKRVTSNPLLFDYNLTKLLYYIAMLSPVDAECVSARDIVYMNAIELGIDDYNFWFWRKGLRLIRENVVDKETFNAWPDPEDWSSECSAFAKQFGCAVEVFSRWDIDGHRKRAVAGPDGSLWVDWLDEGDGKEKDFNEEPLESMVVHRYMPDDFKIKFDLGQIKRTIIDQNRLGGLKEASGTLRRGQTYNLLVLGSNASQGILEAFQPKSCFFVHLCTHTRMLPRARARARIII